MRDYLTRTLAYLAFISGWDSYCNIHEFSPKVMWIGIVAAAMMYLTAGLEDKK